MHILILNRFFDDPAAPTARMAADVARELVARGHAVTVYCGTRAYLDGGAGERPSSVPRPPSSGTAHGSGEARSVTEPLTRRRTEDGGRGTGDALLRVHTLWTPRNRALAWLVFWMRMLVRVPFTPCDRILFLTDPPFMTIAGWLAKHVRPRLKCVWWTMDLYPEALVAAGIVREGGLVERLLRRLNRLGLRAMDRVVCLGGRQAERVGHHEASSSVLRPPSSGTAHGTSEARDATEPLTHRKTEYGGRKTVVVPPWDSRELHHVPHAANRFRATSRLQRKHLVLYAGNLGRGHSFEEMLQGAVALREAGRTNWHVVFVVGGARRGELTVAARGLSNVTIHEYVAPEMMNELMWAADVHLITMARGFDGVIVPSKLATCLRTDAPILFIGPPESDTAREIARHHAGASLPNDCKGEDVVAALDRLSEAKRVPEADVSEEAVGRVVEAVVGRYPPPQPGFLTTTDG